MRIIQVSFLFIAVACNQSLLAQMRVLRATSQSWSGGIAGRSGVNYTFLLQCPVAGTSLHFDTLWIGNEPVPLQRIKNGGGDENTLITTNGKMTRITINARITREQELSPLTNKNKINGQRPPIPYKGVALLAYKQQHSQKYLIIDRITSQLPSLSFP